MNASTQRRSFKEHMHQVREDAIVEAARRLLGTKGFEAMTVDEVAADVGIAKASLYKHFPGKDELCTAAMVRIVQDTLRYVQGLDASGAHGALHCLQTLLEQTFRWQLDDVMPLLPARHSGLLRPLQQCEGYQAAMGQLQQHLLGWIEQAKAEGDLRQDWPASVMLACLLARASDPMLEMLRMQQTHTDAQIIEWAVQACLEGLQGASQRELASA